MKTSNKLLLGFFALIIVAITIGFIILKMELKSSGISVSEASRHKIKQSASVENSKIVILEKNYFVNFISIA